MFVHVKLLQGYQKTLTYKIPVSWDTCNLVGSIITVPLKQNIVPALVIRTLGELPTECTYEIKEAIRKDHLPPDTKYATFIEKISQLYFTPKNLFYQRIRKFVLTREKARTTPLLSSTNQALGGIPSVSLTQAQQEIVYYCKTLLSNPTYAPILLHGVTGSGKTEVYKKIIEHAIGQNQTVLLLHPEVSLSMQFEHLLRTQLPQEIPIFSFHSATKAKEKKLLWEYLLARKGCLILGVHLPIMLPIANLSTIIVDEEHEQGFAEKKHPKINSKEMALLRAKLYNIPIILGSATPSINSIHNAQKHNWKTFKLSQRFAGTFPKIQIVYMNKNKERKHFWITNELKRAIEDRLRKKEQIIIYLNRRGYSFFVQCKACGYTFLCPNCSVSLKLHKQRRSPHGPLGANLQCHYCDYTQANPHECHECKAPEKHLLKKGIGTQRVVSMLEEIFPHAKIARADLDTTKKKRAWTETISKFDSSEIDILVGTQTITKGYHFPNVTLVGILWADLNVHFPFFNASETALQQLIQVAGRAGRQSDHSLVIAQVIHDHPIFQYLEEEKYLEFCKEELRFREETHYPPFGRFLQIELKHANEAQVEADAKRVAQLLAQYNQTLSKPVSILGPTKPLVYRIQKTEIRHIFIKSPNFAATYRLLGPVFQKAFESKIYVVPT